MTKDQESDLEDRIGNLLFSLEQYSAVWHEDSIYDLHDLLRQIRRGALSYEDACDRFKEIEADV